MFNFFFVFFISYSKWRRFNFFEKEIFSESKDQLIELAKVFQNYIIF